MKMNALSLCLLFVITVSNISSVFGQHTGYWVIESNIHTKDYTIVRFYNDANEQIYEEKLNGVVLNLKRKKTTQQLNNALDKAIQNGLSNQSSTSEKNWVADMFKK